MWKAFSLKRLHTEKKKERRGKGRFAARCLSFSSFTTLTSRSEDSNYLDRTNHRSSSIDLNSIPLVCLVSYENENTTERQSRTSGGDDVAVADFVENSNLYGRNSMVGLDIDDDDDDDDGSNHNNIAGNGVDFVKEAATDDANEIDIDIDELEDDDADSNNDGDSEANANATGFKKARLED
mmetsp:Transcript_1133/g.2609  ORF Transcript_1133/g.2609 Transcript_1133/m.2609 type:complete len:181 (+) Transcript_1133:168-710(+)